MNLDAYDDMMGLEFGDYGMLDGLFDPEMLKEALIASSAGGGAILLATWGIKNLGSKVGLDKIASPLLRTAVVSGVTMLAGLAAGRQIMRYNQNVGIGVASGVGALAMANLLDAALSQMTGSARMFTALGEGEGYEGYDDGMSALAALETTNVESAPGAFSGFSDPTVTPEMLMGLDAAVVQQETLGGYAPWNA
jgi:hypothetical protein